MIKNLQKSNPTSSQSRKSTSQRQTSSTGRLNEPLLTGRRTKGSRASRGVPLTGKNYIVDQAEREAWVRINVSVLRPELSFFGTKLIFFSRCCKCCAKSYKQRV